MASDPTNLSPDELVLEVDGDGVHLETLDAPRVLELATAYLELLRKIAEDRDEDLRFTGLRAFEKCGSLATQPSDPELARIAAQEAHRLVSANTPQAYGLRGLVGRVREARRALPDHYSAIVRVRGLAREIFAAPSSSLKATPYATCSMRAYVVRVGGSKPRGAFRSKSEPRQFNLDLTADQATGLAMYLYTTVDIVARVARDESGYIEEGVLKEFHPLTDVDPRTAWVEWFRTSGAASPLADRDDETDGD